MKTRIIIAFTKHHCKDLGYKGLNENFKSSFGFSGEEFLKWIDKIFLKKYYPQCTRIIINQWTGTYSYFYLTLEDKDKNKILVLKVDRGYSKTDYKFKDISDVENNKIIQEAFDEYQNKVFKKLCKDAGISLNKKSINDVVVINYSNYKPVNRTTLSGNIFQIIDDYVTHNDRMKYCNGSYWSFEDIKINKIYTHFITYYKGNYFLDNAVRRGCIID